MARPGTTQDAAQGAGPDSGPGRAEAPILLVEAPYRAAYGGGGLAVSHYFPLGLGYLASYLEKQGRQVELLVENPRVDFWQELTDRLTRRSYLCVGISSMTSAFPMALRIARLVKGCPRPAPVILGGAHVTGVGAQALRAHDEIDFLVLGEGEITLWELVRWLSEPLRRDNAEAAAGDLLGQARIPGPGQIPGLVWREAAGTVVTNPPRPFHPQVDDFPPPARHLVELADFSLHAHTTGGGGRGATMLSSRGCPFGCLFCAAHLTDGKKYRVHSQERILSELRLLRDRHGIRHVFFEDDVITVLRRRLLDLCQALVAAELGMTFGCFSTVQHFDEELAQAMSRAGFRLVIFGMESGDQAVLARLGKGKGATLEAAREAIDRCRRYGMRSYASFVVGFPFETAAQVDRTLAFGRALRPSMLTFNPLVPFPGTPLFDPRLHTPEDSDGWSAFVTSRTPPFDMNPELSAQRLMQRVNRAHLRYYLHPFTMWRMLRETGSWGEIWALFMGFLGLLARLGSHGTDRRTAQRADLARSR
ncbi:MAG: radical SAM protein [Azospirillum sp.]|nr:radical SAM protein [Azospirillum sp.]